MEQTSEDLKAFERRLTEVIACMQPAAGRWRLLLLLLTAWLVYGAYGWLSDPSTAQVTLLESLHNHLLFTASLVVTVALFACGIHKRVVAPSIVAARCRAVLADFNMSCDDSGRLLLRPRPTTP